MGDKRFKDPIYGYIEVDEELIIKVVDTAAFQRLRDIIQTSYSPLYSSAVHNRFGHSLGVYYLGRMAAQAFLDSLTNLSSKLASNIQKYIRTFELACMLHDVGHAPFSHTGEKFYLEKGERTKLHKQIIKLTQDNNLAQEIKDKAYKAAPHELMSVIVSLQTFTDIIPDDMKSFFARCIIGYQYVNDMDEEKSCLNCLIELLNSKIIDVDKLDYLLRDSYMTGFDTVRIDYVRLLNSICVVKDSGNRYRIGYNKAAVSVIENVVYAHDAERKWIQNHPIVLYDAYLIENAMNQIMRQILKSEKLDVKLLSEQGVNVKGFGKVRLMGDSDIRYLMKNLMNCDYAQKYYDRNNRKHPVWKTEAEFQAIFQGHEKELAIIEDEFSNLGTYLRSRGLPFAINLEAIEACEAEVTELQKSLEKANGFELEKNKTALAEKSRHIEWMKILEEFAQKEGIDCDFLIIYTNQFNSGFRKQEFENIEMIFPELRVPCKFKDVTNVLTARESKGERFFFLYYSRNSEKKKVSINELIQRMLELANKILLEKSMAGRLI